LDVTLSDIVTNVSKEYPASFFTVEEQAEWKGYREEDDRQRIEP
jgi:hypothetical protein